MAECPSPQGILSAIAWLRKLTAAYGDWDTISFMSNGRYVSNMSNGRYVSKKSSNRQCEGERFCAEGLPIQCNDTPVFELVHSNGKSIHVCEYHIEFYWNTWLTFRDAVRDIWPVEQRRGGF